MSSTIAGSNAGGGVVVVHGTDNVFVDLGYTDAVDRQAKLRLAYAINDVLKEHNVTGVEAARVLGVTQQLLSALGDYKLAGFTMKRLATLLNALTPSVDVIASAE